MRDSESGTTPEPQDPMTEVGEQLLVMALVLRPHLHVVEAAAAKVPDVEARFLLQDALRKIGECMEQYDEGSARLDRAIEDWLNETAPIDDLVSNTIANFADTGIRLSTSNTSERFEGAEISANEIYVDEASTPNNLVGIRLAKPGNGTSPWLVDALISGNRVSATVASKIDRHGQTVPFIVIAGNVGARAIFEGDGEPEDHVAAPFGSLYLRVDADTSTAMYSRASGPAQPAGYRWRKPSSEALR